MSEALDKALARAEKFLDEGKSAATVRVERDALRIENGRLRSEVARFETAGYSLLAENAALRAKLAKAKEALLACDESFAGYFGDAYPMLKVTRAALAGLDG